MLPESEAVVPARDASWLLIRPELVVQDELWPLKVQVPSDDTHVPVASDFLAAGHRLPSAAFRVLLRRAQDRQGRVRRRRRVRAAAVKGCRGTNRVDDRGCIGKLCRFIVVRRARSRCRC